MCGKNDDRDAEAIAEGQHGRAIHVLKYLEKAVHQRWPMTFEAGKRAVGAAVGFEAAAAGAGAAGFGADGGAGGGGATTLAAGGGGLGVGLTALPALAAATKEVLQYLETTARAKASPASKVPTTPGALQWAFALAVVHRFAPA